MLFSDRVPFLSRDLGSRSLYVRPDQPSANQAFSPDGLWISRTQHWSIPFCWDFRKLANPHLVVVGVSGSGKSYFVKNFLTKASLLWGTKSLILDWSGEYRDWVTQAGGQVLSLGKESLNPLDLGGLAPLERIQQLLPALSLLADIRDSGQKQWLALALESAYRAKGFVLSKPSGKKPPTLKDVHAWLLKRSMGRSSVETLALHLRGLCNHDFFNRQSTLDLEAFFDKPLVGVDLTGLPSESFRSLVALTLLSFCRERMRKEKVTEGKSLNRFLVLDEAWKICGDEGDPAVLVREGRKHGLGLIMATQNPQDVSRTILSNAGSLFLFRTPHAESLDALQQSLRFSQKLRETLSSLPVGVCAAHLLWHDGASNTFLLQRVEGEALLQSCLFEVNDMTWTMEKSELLAWMSARGLEKTRLVEWLAHRGYSCDAADFCAFLDENKVSPDDQAAFLKKLGLEGNAANDVFAAKKERAFGRTARFAKVALPD